MFEHGVIKFSLLALAGIVGNGIGAWNIRTIASGRLIATACLTFIAATVNTGAIREISRDISGLYVLAWALGSTVGITTTVYLDKRFFPKHK